MNASPYSFYFMHFMPYTALPKEHEDPKKYPSTWVELPNRLYDPAAGKRLYKRYIGELVMADRLGYDGVVVNEHHSTAYSMMPAPNLIGSILAHETKQAQICVWGTPPGLTYPNRLAEEYGMIDVMSGGRLEIAFPLGTGMEYWVNSVNPTTARARYREAIRLIRRAWSEDGPFTHHGDFYTYHYMNVWPRPAQKMPPCYVVGSGSPETIDFAAELGLGYSVAFASHKAQIALNTTLREKAKAHGHTIRPNQLPIGVMAYVAETEEKAVEEYLPHIRWFFERALRTTGRYLVPPGYVSVAELAKRAAHGGTTHGGFDWDIFTRDFRIVAGTPDTVAEKIVKWMEDTASSQVTAQLHLGDMPHWKTVKNMTLFAEEVMPRVRKAAPKMDGLVAAPKRQPAMAEAK
ncbi:MAG TPA: LLM class flavin-dependent oxidoreductase [Hyphomicrobiales bacterium]|nr:LLM class flavin-dependent oxidoreductase [Hyphomicrobiales bacterium]